MEAIIFLVVIGTSIWVAVDASNLGVKRGSLGKGAADMGPAGWFFASLLIWIIGFPLYLVTRPKYVALRSQRTGAPTAATPMSHPVPGNGPPAGWYADPERPGASRWWDGYQWGQVMAPPPPPPPPPPHPPPHPAARS